MLEKGKTDIAERTLAKYEDQLGRALEKLEELKTRGDDVKELTDQLKGTTEKHLEVLQENLAKVPEQARQGLERALEASRKGIERGGAAKVITVKLGEQNNSGEAGTAVLKEENGKTKVMLRLSGAPEGITQPAHIHTGSCAAIGSVKWPLTFPVNGKSDTTLDLALAQLSTEMPLAINVHKSVSEAGVYVSCGEITF
jgi:predicted RNase H-like HicB family nuclease